MTNGRVCPKCRGVGWVVRANGGVETVVVCEACRKKPGLGRRVRAAGIPPRYWDQGFKTFSTPDPSQETALLRAIEFADAFPEVERGLLFVGPCGVGKTHLSVGILKAVLDSKAARVRFVDEAELLRSLHYTYNRDARQSEEEVLEPLREADLLVWDDLGTGRPTDWVRETIHTIINHRYTYRRLTIFSSNWKLSPRKEPPEGSRMAREATLPDRIGERLYSRILEMCEIVEMEGLDFRRDIHKAGKDFHQAQQVKVRRRHRLECPHCSSSRVKELDRSKEKLVGETAHVELMCRCSNCDRQFLAREFKGDERVRYASITGSPLE